MNQHPGRTVTKKELVQRIAEELDQTKVVVRGVVQKFLDEIVEELARGNRLEFREFGVFEVRERSQRRAQNPRTLSKVVVPPRRVVRFKVGRAMRDLMSEDAAPPVPRVKAPAPPVARPEPPQQPLRPSPPKPPPTSPGSPF